MGRTRGPVRPGPARPPRRPGPRDAAPQLAAAELADDDPRAARRGLRPPTPAAARTEPGRRPQAPKQPGPEPPEGDPLMPRRWLTRQLQQLRLVPALLVPTARAIGWAPPLAAFALSVGLLVLAVRRGASSAEGLVVWLRIIMVAGALGSAFLLDDPSEPTTEAVAGSLLLRRALRVALLLPATAAWWAAAVWRVRAVHPGRAVRPAGQPRMGRRSSALGHAARRRAGGVRRRQPRPRPRPCSQPDPQPIPPARPQPRGRVTPAWGSRCRAGDD